MTGFYNWDGVCLLHGTDWIFISLGLILVFISHTGPCEIFGGQSGSPLSISFQQCSTLIFVLLLPERQTGESVKPCKRQCSFEKPGALDRPAVFKLSSHAPLSRHKTRSRTVPLATANINAYFQDTGLPWCFVGSQVWRLQTCQPAQQHRCEQLKFRSCYFSNSKRLADTGQSLFTLQQGNSILIYAL